MLTPGWSQLFIDALDAPSLTITYRLRRLAVSQEPGLPFEAVAVAPQLGGSRVVPRSWRSTIGSWSVDILGDPSAALAALPRGTIVELLATAAGHEERIAVGQVRNLRGLPPRLRVEVLELLSVVRSPLDVTSSTARMFGNVSATTNAISGETIMSGTYDVLSTTGFQKETGGNGAILVTPTAGAPYYRLWSSSAATSFTIADPTTAAVMGTTDVGCGLNDPVAEVGYVSGHPCDVALKVLTSTGAGTNGAYDTLPDQWGLELGVDLVDANDIQALKSVVTVSSGSYLWQVPVTAEVTDPMSWMEALLAPSGLWLTTRQGRLTMRAAHDPSGTWSPYIDTGVVIEDAEVVSIDDYEAWCGEHDVEWNTCNVTTFNGTSVGRTDGTQTATLPSGYTTTKDVSAFVFANDNAIRGDVQNRQAAAELRIPERLVLTTRRRSRAGLASGDRVVLNLVSPRVASRAAGLGNGVTGGFQSRAAMVMGVSPNWARGTVQLHVCIYPETEYS